MPPPVGRFGTSQLPLRRSSSFRGDSRWMSIQLLSRMILGGFIRFNYHSGKHPLSVGITATPTPLKGHREEFPTLETPNLWMRLYLRAAKPVISRTFLAPRSRNAFRNEWETMVL